jgi:hypothetical protein
MIRAHWATPLIAVLLLAGCPFSSTVPLANPANGIQDQALADGWRAQDPETGESVTLSFQLVSGGGYSAETLDSDGEKETYRAVASTVGDERFLSLQQVGAADQDWYIARYRISGDTLQLAFVDDGLIGSTIFASSADLRAFIGEHLADPLLFAPVGEQGMVTQFSRAR